MKKIWKKIRKDSGGFSLVEVLCALAILGVVSATVGGVMIFSVNSYSRGNDETQVQQEMQFTANRISGLVMDATDSVEYGFFGAEGNVPAENETRAIALGATPNSDRYLKIVQSDTIVMIRFLAADKELTYWEIDRGTLAQTDAALLAENISDFEADTTDFTDAKNVVMTMAADVNGQAISSIYNISARNKAPVRAEASTTAIANLHVSGEIVVEPGQEYFLPVTVTAVGTTEMGFLLEPVPSGERDDGTEIARESGGIRIRVSVDETGGADGKIYLTLHTKANDDEGNPLDTMTVALDIRRTLTNVVEGNPVPGTPAENPDTAFKTGARYRVNGIIGGQNLDQVFGQSFDMDYKNPYYEEWSLAYEENGSRYPEGSATFEEHFRIVSRIEDYQNPYVIVELREDMPKDSKLIVTGTAKHAAGTIGTTQYNKSGLEYAEISDTYELISDLQDPGPFTSLNGIIRGGEIMFGFGYDANALRTGYTPHGQYSEVTWLWRIRPIQEDGTYGAWGTYRKMMQNSVSNMKLNTDESRVFAPDVSYELELVATVLNTGSRQIYYPRNEEFVNAMNAQGYSKGYAGSSTTDPSEFRSRFVAERIGITFKRNDGAGVSEDDPTFRTEANPVVLRAGTRNYQFNCKLKAIDAEKYQGGYRARVQRKVGSNWINDTNSMAIQSEMVNSAEMRYRINEIRDSAPAGLYRIQLYLDNAGFKTDNGGDVANPRYRDVNYSSIFYDEEGTKGTVYIQVVK